MTHELALDPAELAPPLSRQVCGAGASSRPELRIAGGKAMVDLGAAERAAAGFPAAMGIDRSGAGLRATPARMARACTELFDVRPLAGTLRAGGRARAGFLPWPACLPGISSP